MRTNRLKDFGIYRYQMPVKLYRAARKSRRVCRRYWRAMHGAQVVSRWSERGETIFKGPQKFYGGRVSFLGVSREPAGNSRKSSGSEVAFVCFDEVQGNLSVSGANV